MDNYTKYILLSHLHWIEKGITKEEIYRLYQEIEDEDIFSGVKMHQIQEKMGCKVSYKEVITASDYEKIKFLWLSLSRFKIDLSFVKFCIKLEEINIGCFDEINLDSLKENTKLKHIIANGNKIQNIEALYAHTILEVLNIENNPCLSLKPIAHLKKLKEVEIDLIEEEIDALTILRNNPNCNLNYIIKSNARDFNKFTSPFFHIIIIKSDIKIRIIIEAIERTVKYSGTLAFSKELQKKPSFKNEYLSFVKDEIINRLEIIIGAPIKLNFEELIYYHDYYMFEYSHVI